MCIIKVYSYNYHSISDARPNWQSHFPRSANVTLIESSTSGLVAKCSQRMQLSVTCTYYTTNRDYYLELDNPCLIKDEHSIKFIANSVPSSRSDVCNLLVASLVSWNDQLAAIIPPEINGWYGWTHKFMWTTDMDIMVNLMWYEHW